MSEEKLSISYFDRMMGNLHGLPDVVSAKPTTLRVVPPLGLGTHLYAVQTFRQREIGDTVFLEHVSEAGTTRLVIPPTVVETIVRQRDALTTKVRVRTGKQIAADRKALGLKPGFMKHK